MSQVRLSLDVPYRFAVETGFQKTQHCSDIPLQTRAVSDINVFQDPLTKLLMLRPKFVAEDFYSTAMNLSEFNSAPGYWKQSTRADTPVINSVIGASAAPTGIEVPASIIVPSLTPSKMKWVLHSKTLLGVDEGFVINISPSNDELKQPQDWFFVQWDNLGIHFSSTGYGRVYRYDRAAMNDADKTVQIDSFQFAMPGKSLHSFTQFVFLPIPSYGLALYFSNDAEDAFRSGGVQDASVLKGYLVELPAREVAPRKFRLFESSTLRIGMNTDLSSVFSIYRLRFASEGSFTDTAFNIGYVPISSPAELVANTLYTENGGTVTPTLWQADGQTAWSPGGTNRHFRVRCQLATADSRYTPFLYNYFVRWDAVYATRATTAIEVSEFNRTHGTLTMLEWTDNVRGWNEGMCQLLAHSSALKAIVERGDTTFKLESREDANAPWQVEGTGLATVNQVTRQKDMGGRWWYAASMNLHDYWYRLTETQIKDESAFDNSQVGEAINLVLRGSGLPVVRSLPADSLSVFLQANAAKPGNSVKFRVRRGQTGEDAIRLLLLFLKRQNREYKLVYDHENEEFRLEQRLKLTTPQWTLSAYQEDADAAARIWYYSHLEFVPEPPEATRMRLEGVTSQDSKGQRIPVEYYSHSALYDPGNRNYLGRAKNVLFGVWELDQRIEVEKWARRLADAVFAHRMKIVLQCPKAATSLKPDAYVAVQNPDRATLANAWVKARTRRWETVLTSMSLHLDTHWDSSLKGG